MFYAVEVRRVHVFDKVNERNDFVEAQPVNRIAVCHRCGRKALKRRKENEFLNEVRVGK
jgi:hypothetical protein